RVRDPSNRHDVGGLVGQVFVDKRMRGEGSAWCSQEHMVIVGAHERADGDETVSAGAILDDDRLAPAPAQSIPDQSRADIDTAAGPSVTMNLTARCGQVGAFDGCAARTSTARQAMPNARRCMLSNGTSDVTTRGRRRAAARKQRCPAGVLYHFPPDER